MLLFDVVAGHFDSELFGRPGSSKDMASVSHLATLMGLTSFRSNSDPLDP